MPEVVLVHGLWYRCWSMALLKKRLAAHGFQVRCFSYPTLAQRPDVSARALAGFCRKSGLDTVHLVGHSLGGLLILAMLGQGGYQPSGRLLLLGTPLAGSRVARRTAGWPGGKLLLGHCGDLLAGGASAAARAWTCGMIAGTRGIGLGRLTGVRLGPGDGTVAVEETHHQMVSERLELPVSHTGLLASRTVAEEAAHFLAYGHFHRL